MSIRFCAGFSGAERQKRPADAGLFSSRFLLRLPDIVQQVLLRIVKQQLFVVCVIRLASEVLDEPRGEEIRGQLGGEQHELLAVRDGRVEERKGVCQLLVRPVGRVRTRLHVGLEQFLEPVEGLPLGYLFERDGLLERGEAFGLARGDKQRVLIG